MAALTQTNHCQWLGIHANASKLTPTPTTAVLPCEPSKTWLRTLGAISSDRYTACVATMPPTPSVLSTDSTTRGQKSNTCANGHRKSPPSNVDMRIAGRRPYRSAIQLMM